MNYVRYIPYAIYSLFVFKNPYTFLKGQFGIIKNFTVETRERETNLLLRCWGREDASSLSVIFLKHEYGTIKRGHVVFDIGANKGYFSLFAAKSGARVYAFEPDTSTFEKLKEVISENNSVSPKITLFKKGIAGKSGQHSFFHDPKSSIASSMLFNSENTIETTIECTTIRDVLQEERITTIDVLKIDAEGAEYSTFYTMDDKTFRAIKEIRMEYHTDVTNEKNTISQLQKHIISKGFIMTKLQPAGEGCGIVWFTNKDTIKE